MVNRDRRGQKIENKTDRQMFSLSFFFFFFWVGGQAPARDITFHIPHEHFLPQQISSSCSLRRVLAALTFNCNAREPLRFSTTTPALPQQNAGFNGQRLHISHWTDKWGGFMLVFIPADHLCARFRLMCWLFEVGLQGLLVFSWG